MPPKLKKAPTKKPAGPTPNNSQPASKPPSRPASGRRKPVAGTPLGDKPLAGDKPAAARPSKEGSTSLSPQEQEDALKDALSHRLREVADLFKKWDVDGNGLIDKAEFRKAVEALGYRFDGAIVDAVFDVYDADKSGSMEYKEFVQYSLSDSLRRTAGKVMNLFKQWDKDGSGSVDRKEFRKAIRELGFDCETGQIDSLFDEIDRDGGGCVDFKELNKALRAGAHHGRMDMGRSRKKLPPSLLVPAMAPSGAPATAPQRPSIAMDAIPEGPPPPQWINAPSAAAMASEQGAGGFEQGESQLRAELQRLRAEAAKMAAEVENARANAEFARASIDAARASVDATHLDAGAAASNLAAMQAEVERLTSMMMQRADAMDITHATVPVNEGVQASQLLASSQQRIEKQSAEIKAAKEVEESLRAELAETRQRMLSNEEALRTATERLEAQAERNNKAHKIALAEAEAAGARRGAAAAKEAEPLIVERAVERRGRRWSSNGRRVRRMLQKRHARVRLAMGAQAGCDGADPVDGGRWARAREDDRGGSEPREEERTRRASKETIQTSGWVAAKAGSAGSSHPADDSHALAAELLRLEAQLEARVKMEASLRQQLEVQVAATFEAQTKAKALREALEVAQDLRAAASRIRGQPYGGGGGGDTRLAPYDSSSSGSLMLFGGRRSCW